MRRSTPVDDLVAKLTRPTFVLQMARGGEDRNDGMGKSCRTRADKARKEIDHIVREYARD